jgi:phosphoadenosine phosphosulfate reductase
VATVSVKPVLDRDGVLRRLVTQAAEELQGATALEILKWADVALDGRLVIASSMQDAVVIDLAAQVRPGIDVVFLDTGYHFAETIGMRDAVAATYPVRVLNVSPSQTVEEQDATYGPRLYERDPDQCCFMRKVKPLDAMLEMYDGWITGLRRTESPSRADAAAIEWDSRRRMLKVNPIVEWSDEDVDSYIEERNLLVNPLIGDGYASIGCQTCTIKVAPQDNARSGRWAGMTKQECGIHL